MIKERKGIIIKKKMPPRGNVIAKRTIVSMSVGGEV